MPPRRLPTPLSLSLPLRPHLPPDHHYPSPPHTRPASHASQGRANKAAPGPGKRLGLKRPASSLVVPGNIIFRQRGTHWYPGENCGMGRDHTIFAREKGYVVFYRDRVGTENGRKGRERKFIGVVFTRGEGLPRGRGRGRVRRLGLVGRVREPDGDGGEERMEGGGLTQAQNTIRQQSNEQRAKVPEVKKLELRPGYQYRESNWEIGRAAERANVKVRAYKRGDRFLAWRKLNARRARNAERRSLSSRKKKGNSK